MICPSCLPIPMAPLLVPRALGVLHTGPTPGADRALAFVRHVTEWPFLLLRGAENGSLGREKSAFQRSLGEEMPPAQWRINFQRPVNIRLCLLETQAWSWREQG